MAKVRKVEEPAGTFQPELKVSKTALSKKTGMQVVQLADVRKANAQLMQTHRKVLQKLAQ